MLCVQDLNDKVSKKKKKKKKILMTKKQGKIVYSL